MVKAKLHHFWSGDFKLTLLLTLVFCAAVFLLISIFLPRIIQAQSGPTTPWCNVQSTGNSSKRLLVLLQGITTTYDLVNFKNTALRFPEHSGANPWDTVLSSISNQYGGY